MRLKMHLETQQTVRIPINYQDHLRGVVYRLLGFSDETYARRVHDDGWNDSATDAHHRLKLFTFSGLRVPSGRRRIENGQLVIAPGAVEWLLASPLDDFLQHEVQGMLTGGGTLRIGESVFRLTGAEAFAAPEFPAGEDGLATVRYTCLSPIVASVPSPEGRPTAYYLRPKDGTAFSDALRKNLLRKYALAYDAPPSDDRFTLTFDETHWRSHPHGGTKKITLHGTDIIGAFVPFTLTAPPALHRAAWELGIGEKTGSGFGMIEVAR